MDNSSVDARDVFISYASEDREAVAKPLAQLLASLGVSVWFDQFDLKIGDSLHRKLDEGMRKSRYGIVILSTAFFDKHYTNLELNGLFQREADGKKVILPVWFGVDKKQILSFSLLLADRIACRWEDGIYAVVIKLIEVIKPGAIEAVKKRMTVMPRLTTGREVVDVVTGCQLYIHSHDETNSDVEICLVGGFIQELRDWCEVWDDMEVSEQMRTTAHISEMIGELKSAGWIVCGSRISGKKKIAGVEDDCALYAIMVVRGEPERVVFMDGQIMVFRV